VQDLAGLAASVELLLEVGIDRIAAHLAAIEQPLVAWLDAHPDVEVVSDLEPERRSAILSFKPPSVGRMFASLKAAGVRTALREGAIRISPHLYNDRTDIDRLLDVLDAELARP
jgi:selenocysteine lyase/cysteine desulfurase